MGFLNVVNAAGFLAAPLVSLIRLELVPAQSEITEGIQHPL